MAEGDNQRVPEVQVYWRDRRDLYANLAGAAISPLLGFILALQRLPATAYEWVVMVLTAAGPMTMVLKSRSLATPEHAGAMRFTRDAMKMLPRDVVEDIVTAAEVPRSQEKRP